MRVGDLEAVRDMDGEGLAVDDGVLDADDDGVRLLVSVCEGEGLRVSVSVLLRVLV